MILIFLIKNDHKHNKWNICKNGLPISVFQTINDLFPRLNSDTAMNICMQLLLLLIHHSRASILLLYIFLIYKRQTIPRNSKYTYRTYEKTFKTKYGVDKLNHL